MPKICQLKVALLFYTNITQSRGSKTSPLWGILASKYPPKDNHFIILEKIIVLAIAISRLL